MEGDLIFVNIDPGFDTALRALRELEKPTRLETKNHQEAWLDVIQSNAKGDDKIFKFGGESPPKQALAFGRTASAVFRMVMLRAVGIEEDFWPNLGNNTMRRNKEALRFAVSKQFKNKEALKLVGENTNNKTVQLYYEKYDQVFPPTLISGRLSTNKGKNVPFHNKMLIFRNNFEEVIIIETTANATMYPSSDLGWESEREFDSDVKVTCTRKTIMPGEDGEHFKKLKALSPGAGQEQAQPMTRGRGKVLDQVRADMELNKELKEPKKDKHPVAELTNKMRNITTDSGDDESTTA